LLPFFQTTPAQLRLAFKTKPQRQYVCTQCKRVIREEEYMKTDMAKPTEGWQHFICPLPREHEEEIMNEDRFTFYVVLGMIGVVLVCAALFWGTIGAVAYHFIHKFW
jgi:hypothetical protein